MSCLPKASPVQRIVWATIFIGFVFAESGRGADPEPNPGSGQPTVSRSDEAVLFEELPVVEAASLHVQTLREAPANVTVISAEEIRTYGYRTLGEALENVRGFYVSHDRAYHYVGLRGFNLPGDYSNRFLVMLNGHYLTDNVYNAFGRFGQDSGIDLEIVERIEVIRGPSSAIYGSNGIFATINIVTRSPVDHETGRAGAEYGTHDQRRGYVASSAYLGGGANLLVSGSVFNYVGRSLYLPDFDDPETNNGVADGVDRQKGYHTFANLIWRDWSVTTSFNSWEQQVPTGWYETIFNGRGNKVSEGRNFIEGAYSRDLGAEGHLHWRLYYDQYRFRGRYDYDLEDDEVEDNRDRVTGDWVGSRLTYRFQPSRLGALTLGAEVNIDTRAEQRNFDVSPEPVEYLNVSRRDRTYGIFAQQEWDLSQRWKAYLGLRFDDSKNNDPFVSPRAAFVYEHSPQTVYKFLYGRAFRNPSAYEKFYHDAEVQLANPLLGAEKANTFEAGMERKIGRRLDAVATVYHYRLRDLIEIVEFEDETVQYQNVSKNHATGVELELGGRPVDWLRATGSFSIQKLTESETGRSFPNSPRTMAKVRLTAPLVTKKLRMAAAFRYLSSRRTVFDSKVRPVYLTDVSLTTNRLTRSFELQLGVRNLLDHHYSDPVGFEHFSDRMPRNGRTAFVRLVWRTGE